MGGVEISHIRYELLDDLGQIPTVITDSCKLMRTISKAAANGSNNSVAEVLINACSKSSFKVDKASG